LPLDLIKDSPAEEVIVCTTSKKSEEKERTKSVDLNIVDLEILPQAELQTEQKDGKTSPSYMSPL